MMSKRLLAVAAVFLGLAASSVSADTLGIGDPAPKLEVGKFVKGDAIKGLEKGKAYVVEFWATWCGPCRTSIPHLTELSKKYKDITFIGVSVWERNPKAVEPFVKEMGDKMDYLVATDDVGEKEDADGGKMAKNWMTAAGQDGIPASFIVNKEGLIAWIGHPMEMDKPLAQIADGTYDLKAAVAKFKEAQVVKEKMIALRAKFVKAQKSGDPKELLKVIDEAISDDAKLEARLGLQKFIILQKTDEADKALAYGKILVEKVFKDDSQMLNQIAWRLVDPEGDKTDPKLLKLALLAGERADKITESKDPAIADTYAKALFDNGQVAKALEVQERAVKQAKGTALEKDQSMKDRLEQYKKANEKK